MKMAPADLETRLASAVRPATSNGDYAELGKLTDELIASNADLEAVKVILMFMEDHPNEDIGSPGPLVRFAEEFIGQGYEGELRASLRRRPTQCTVAMLFRVMNGLEDDSERAKMLRELTGVIAHPRADLDVRETVAQFLSDTSVFQ